MKNKVILLVEDCAIVSWYLQTVLENLGWKVLPILDCEEVDTLCQQYLPDLLLTNCCPAVTDSRLSFSNYLRINYQTPAIFITGSRPKDFCMHNDFYQGSYILHKPFTQWQLEELIDEIFHS